MQLSPHAAIFLLSTRGLERRGRDALAAYVRAGGGLLIAAGPDIDAEVVADVLGPGAPLRMVPPADARPQPMPLIYLLAGEASGDVLGGRLMAAIMRQRPGVEFAGVGGPRMLEHGLASLHPMADLAVMGLVACCLAASIPAQAWFDVVDNRYGRPSALYAWLERGGKTTAA